MRKEERKGKEAHVRGLKKKAEPGFSETAKRLGIPQACKHSQEKIKTVQKKKTKKETQEIEERPRPSQASYDLARKMKKESATSYSASGWHLGEQE